MQLYVLKLWMDLGKNFVKLNGQNINMGDLFTDMYVVAIYFSVSLYAYMLAFGI